MRILNFNGMLLLNLKLFLFLLLCSVIGFAINRQLDIWQDKKSSQNNLYLQCFFALSTGLMVNITLLFILGIVGWFSLYAIFTGESVLIVIALYLLFFSKSINNFVIRIRIKSAALLEILALAILFLILTLKSVKVPGYWDDTMYHLPLARFYIENQAIVLNEYLRFPLFPQNMDLLLALGLMIGGDVVAQGMATVPLFIISIGLIGTGVWLFNSIIPGYLSILLLLNLGPVKTTLGYAYIDNGLALFCGGATLALALWINTEHRLKSWVVISGMLAGGAAGIKYFGLVLAFLLGLYILIMRHNWRACFTYSVSIILFGSWWYLRSAIIAGDPFHPVGGNIFGHFLWDAQDLIGQKKQQANIGVDQNLFNVWSGLVKAGVELWVPAFLSLIFFWKEGSSVRFLQIVFLSYFLFWFFATQEPRYLAPIFAVGSFLSVYFLYRAGLGRFIMMLRMRKQWLGNSCIPGALCLVTLLPICAASYKEATSGIVHWSDHISRRPGYTLFHQANKLIPLFGSRLIQVGFENGIYFFNGVAIGDWFGPGRYRSMLNCQDICRLISPTEMTLIMKKFNCRMLAVNKNRFAIDVKTYKNYFDIAYESLDGLLLIEK